MIKVNIKKKLKGYKGDFILDVEFQLEKGQFLSIFGKSGHGKTTLLRIIAGLETPDEGYIEFNGKVYFDSEKKINLPPQKRNVGFVFQDFALFPNMTVYENLTFANRNEKKIHEILKKLEIYELKDRYPSTLSGGQKQRVALGRAIIRNPEILLLDEPLSALDESIRLKLQDEIKKIHNEYGLTSIIVSHDKKEVFKLADRVFVLENGKIVKQGTPRDVFIEKDISGKFSFYGQVIDVRPAGIVNIATIDINDNLVEVVVGNDVKIGDSVLVGVKGFNPVVKVVSLP
ncbi:ATP-binding cassette domain-containing protein [Hydrogenivirga sp. 128-5-R1-1]|uniref:sulfate/molybdate ABC transporter ATP-binding protein n=1 Tax=Hydrogenivirga sp. 128-5-R1-1 TaxID=392423 RepID=UPI00015F2E1E|nr:ATP-binding cassette domain-containing protein [Hydrogenivirga sp. 128-5-R1-1]EDP73105.1 ATPase [Hydrogenivirga sp. 128-5-R1-1]